jgi:hypothetical protein
MITIDPAYPKIQCEAEQYLCQSIERMALQDLRSPPSPESSPIDDRLGGCDRILNIDHVKSTFIYIISNALYSSQNMFKIGKHTGSKKGLIRRYKTYLIEPIVHFFFPSGAISEDEGALLSRLSNFRVGNSEFVKIDLESLTRVVESYFKNKYRRSPSVKLPYPKALVCENVLLDFEEKVLQKDKCFFFPNFDFSRVNNCLDSISIRWQEKEIFFVPMYQLQQEIFCSIHTEYLMDFMKCFMIRFDKMNSYLYIHDKKENGWIEFLKYAMEVLFSYNTQITISRKEFLKKESFHERILFVSKDQTGGSITEHLTPLDLILVKAQHVETCIVFEDDSMQDSSYCYLKDIEIDEKYYEPLIYYFFYLL